MKKLLFSLLLFIGISTLQAQLMPDSTVQICAYWAPKDKCSYDVEEYKYKLDNKGDTSLIHIQRERYTFEVLEKTEDKYRLRLTFDGLTNTDPKIQRISDAIVAAVGPTIVEFETNQFGTFQKLTNLEDVVRQAKKSVDASVKTIWEDLSDAERKVMPFENLRNYMDFKMSDPSVLATAIYENLGRLFFFHGARLDTTREYSMDEAFTSILANQDTLLGKTTFWADSKLTDKYSAVCRTYSEANGNKLIANTLGDIIQVFGVKKELLEGMRDSIASGLKDFRSRLEQYSYEEVQLGTGWPLLLIQERELTLGNDSEKLAVAGVRRTLSLIPEEEKK